MSPRSQGRRPRRRSHSSAAPSTTRLPHSTSKGGPCWRAGSSPERPPFSRPGSPRSSVRHRRYWHVKLGAGLAFAQFSSDLPDEAGREIDLTLENALRVDPGEDVQDWYLSSGRLFRSADYIEAAIRILSSGTERFAALGIADYRVADMYADLAQCYYMMNHPDKAISILDRAISCAEQIGDAILIGRNYLHLALAYTRMNNAALAMAAVKKAEPFCDSSGDPELSAYFAAATQGIAELSIKGMAPATLSESAANTEIGTTGQAGMIQWLRVQIEKADREQSATTAEPLAQLYIHLGVELDRAGQFGESRQAFLEAMRVVRRWELKKLQGAVLQDYGVMLARSGRMESARRIFQAALARKDEFADGADRLTSLSSLAQASQELHRSLDYFSLASQIEREAAQIAASQQATLLVQAAGLYEDSSTTSLRRDLLYLALSRYCGPKRRVTS